jgi:hypothetical protein
MRTVDIKQFIVGIKGQSVGRRRATKETRLGEQGRPAIPVKLVIVQITFPAA